MPGRLWVLFGLQASSAAFCCGLSRMGGSLGGTLGMAVAMALCCTAAAGATFGIGTPCSRWWTGACSVPLRRFVSLRFSSRPAVKTALVPTAPAAANALPLPRSAVYHAARPGRSQWLGGQRQQRG